MDPYPSPSLSLPYHIHTCASTNTAVNGSCTVTTVGGGGVGTHTTKLVRAPRVVSPVLQPVRDELRRVRDTVAASASSKLEALCGSLRSGGGLWCYSLPKRVSVRVLLSSCYRVATVFHASACCYLRVRVPIFFVRTVAGYFVPILIVSLHVFFMTLILIISVPFHFFFSTTLVLIISVSLHFMIRITF